MSDIIRPFEVLKAIQRNYAVDMAKVYPDLSKLVVSIAAPNDTDHRTEFPDFIGENGFIEHFHVSSGGSLSNGGYVITTIESENEKKHYQFRKDGTDKLYRTKVIRTIENNSIENLHASLRRCFKNHIWSMGCYKGKNEIACFLITSDDYLMLKVQRNGEIPVIDPSIGLWYNPIYDKKLLDYLYEYVDAIDYVIYFNIKFGSCSYIKLADIPDIIKKYHSDDSIVYDYNSSPIVLEHEISIS